MTQGEERSYDVSIQVRVRSDISKEEIEERLKLWMASRNELGATGEYVAGDPASDMSIEDVDADGAVTAVEVDPWPDRPMTPPLGTEPCRRYFGVALDTVLVDDDGELLHPPHEQARIDKLTGVLDAVATVFNAEIVTIDGWGKVQE
jgi:hypothetical protein